MTAYRTSDGRVRVFSTRVRSEWHRQSNRRGGVQTLWHAYNLDEDRWIAREHFTLRSIKKTLSDLGYSTSLQKDPGLAKSSKPAHAKQKVVTISVHESEDEEAGEESYTISDNGGEFDDVEERRTDVQGAVDERRLHYRSMGMRAVVDAPARMDLL